MSSKTSNHRGGAERFEVKQKDGLQLEQIYAPFQLKNMKAYTELPGFDPQTAIADIEQAPGFSFRPGHMVGSLTCHVCFHSWQAKRPFVSKELLLFLGIPAYPELIQAHRHPWPLLEHFDRLEPKLQNRLAGNGQHLEVMAAWALYVLMHSRPKPVAIPSCGPCPDPEEEVCEDPVTPLKSKKARVHCSNFMGSISLSPSPSPFFFRSHSLLHGEPGSPSSPQMLLQPSASSSSSRRNGFIFRGSSSLALCE